MYDLVWVVVVLAKVSGSQPCRSSGRHEEIDRRQLLADRGIEPSDRAAESKTKTLFAERSSVSVTVRFGSVVFE